MSTRKRKPLTPKQKRERKKKERDRWKIWKQNQRSQSIRNSKTQVRHHTSGKPTVLNRKDHARRHKRNGTAGGRPRKKGRS